MYEYEEKHGLKSVFRMTPNDLREMNRPPIMRSGAYWDSMLKIFTETAKEGADFLSIESTGGKEINDEAIVNADLRTSIFALGCLGARDMKWLWSNISEIAEASGSIAAGDSACGFANTSMVLAEQGFLPKVYAAVMRAVAAPRALVAIENGAVGPSKDCAYENVYLKAITGTPIALEGKSAACAHFSPIGNIALSVADTWSNESVQQVKLLSDNGTKPSNDFLPPLYSSTAFSPGSTDVGDVSWQTPTAQINTACYAAGAPGHSWQNVAIGATTAGNRGMLQAGRVLAAAAIDILEDPSILTAARAEFEKKTAEGYLCPIPADAVPTPVGDKM